jgi:hypothetical protein
MAQSTDSAHDPFFLNNNLDMPDRPENDKSDDNDIRSPSPPQASSPLY